MVVTPQKKGFQKGRGPFYVKEWDIIGPFPYGYRELGFRIKN